MNLRHTFANLLFTLLLCSMFTLLVTAQSLPSDEKTGSVLVFPYYTSTQAGFRDTRISIHNHGTVEVEVLLYFIENVDCTEANMSVIITPNGTVTLIASRDIPDETGYLIAVAKTVTGVNAGNIQPNAGLSGSAFVKIPANQNFKTTTPAVGAGLTSGANGNYGATAFNTTLATIAPVNGIFTLNFTGNQATGFDAMPTTFAAEIQQPAEAPNQTIVMAGMSGSVATGSLSGANQINGGLAFNEIEVLRSFSNFIRSGTDSTCHSISIVTNSQPRILAYNGVTGLNGFIAAGTTGILRFMTAGGVGLLFTPNNPNGWSGARTLTTLGVSTTVTLDVPAI